MIYVGIDDTDMPDMPGTNQLARALIAHVANRFRCHFVLRHQLLYDSRIPYTSKNGSASIHLEPLIGQTADLDPMIVALRERMLEWYIPGSDPGLCVTTVVPSDISEFGRLCQRDIVYRSDAERLAAQHGIHLEGLGGTRGGMIGALAAVGLAASQNDGRVVVQGAWSDELSGRQPVAVLESRGAAVRCVETGAAVREGDVDIGKHFRPNIREGSVVQFVRMMETPAGREWQAVRLN